MNRQEAGHIVACISPPTVPPCLLIPGRTTGSGKGPGGVFPCESPHVTQQCGRKDGLLTVTFDFTDHAPFDRPDSHFPDFLRTGGVNHDIHPGCHSPV